MPLDIPNSQNAALAAALIGYFPFDGTLADPVTSPPQSGSSQGSVPYVAAWSGHQAIKVSDHSFFVKFPPLLYPEPSPPWSQPREFALSLWFRSDTPATHSQLVFSDGLGFAIFVQQGGLQLSWVGETWQTNSPIMPGWHHVAMSYSAPSAMAPHIVSCWLDGVRQPDHTLQFDVNAQATFKTATTSQGASGAGASVRGYAMFNLALTDDTAAFLAADLFEPEAAYNPQIEYLALSLDAQGQVTADDDPSLNFNIQTGFTVAAWVYTDLLALEPGQSPTIVKRQGCYGLGINDEAQLQGWIVDGSGARVTIQSQYAISTSQWMHAAMTVSSAGLNLYIDGTSCATPVPVQSMASAASAAVSLGTDWEGDIYSAALFGAPLSSDDVSALRGLEPAGAADLPKNCVVYYDLSSSPPRALSAVTALQATPVIPADAHYTVYSRGAALACSAFVDGGFTADTDVAFNLPTTISAWIKLTYLDGVQAIVSRWKNGAGYSLYVSDGVLCCDYAGIAGVAPVSVRSTLILPRDVWIQVGVGSFFAPGGINVALFANGRLIAQLQQDIQPPLDPKTTQGFAPPQTPLMIGARLGPDPFAPTGTEAPTIPTDGMAGYVQRVTIYPQPINPYFLYYEPQSFPASADWAFEGGGASDLVGDHPAQLLAGAEISTSRMPIVPSSAASIATTRAARPIPLNHPGPGEDLFGQIPPEHQVLLANSEELRGRVLAMRLDKSCYLMAYPDALDEQSACLLVTDTDDPTADYIELTVDIIIIGLGVWGLTGPSTKLGKIGVSMWRNPVVRDAFLALYAASVVEMPNAFVTSSRTMYNEGFLSQVVSCFSVSYWTVLRIVALFVPWLAIALVAADLVSVAQRIFDKVRSRKPQSPPAAVQAVCSKPIDLTGAVPVTVNGDPVRVMVSLMSAPASPVVVTGIAGPLAVSPATLSFSPANWMVPQPVELSAAADDDNTAPDNVGVRALWSGAGVAGEAVVDLRIHVARIVCPEVIDLVQNDEGDYEADFDIGISAEVSSAAPVTVTLSVTDPASNPPVTFEPSTLTFSNASADVVGLGNQPATKRVRAKRARAADGPDTVAAVAVGESAPKKPCNNQRYEFSVRKPESTEEITLTMVLAGSGNCFVLKDTLLQNGQVSKTETVVLDGGLSGTYARMSNYLPSVGQPIKYLLCTHYDSDHIYGLIELMRARAADVGAVIFNPARILAENLPATANSLDAFFSVKQSALLAALALAAGKPIIPIIGTPPPSVKVPNIGLATLDFLFAGPSLGVRAANLARPTNSEAINRASIMFMMASNLAPDSGFRFLMTGDGYNIPDKLDVTGNAMAVQKIDFLQVPHHGSIENSNQSLYKSFPAKHYLISCRHTSYKGKHPAEKVVSDIVAAARQSRHTGYSIWISDPDLPLTFSWPMSDGDYSAYKLNDGETGGSFTYKTGQAITTPTNFTQIV